MTTLNQVIAQVNVHSASLPGLAEHFRLFDYGAASRLVESMSNNATGISNPPNRTMGPTRPSFNVATSSPTDMIPLQSDPHVIIPLLVLVHPQMFSEEEQNQLSVVELPSSAVLDSVMLDIPANARAYMNHPAGSPARRAAALIEAFATNLHTDRFAPNRAHDSISRLFPAARTDKVYRQHLALSVRDLSKIFQLMAIKSTLASSVPTAVMAQHYVSGIRASVPQALLRDPPDLNSTSVPWDVEKLFNSWREYLFGDTEPTGDRVDNPVGISATVSSNLSNLPDFLPLDNHNNSFDQTPFVAPGMTYMVALNNIQALSWYLQLTIMQLTSFLDNYRFTVTLSVVIQRHQNPEGSIADVGLAAIPAWKYSYVRATASFGSNVSCIQIATELMDSILAVAYVDGELAYDDLSDTMAIVTGVTVVPVPQSATSAIKVSVIRDSRIKVQPQSLRGHRVSTLYGRTSNPYGVIHVDSRSAPSIFEVESHAQQFFRRFLASVHAHSPMIPAQFLDLYQRYNISSEEIRPFKHQCLSSSLLLCEAVSKQDISTNTFRDKEAECQSFFDFDWESAPYIPSVQDMKKWQKMYDGSLDNLRRRKTACQTNLPSIMEKCAKIIEKLTPIEKAVCTKGNVLEVIELLQSKGMISSFYLLLLEGNAGGTLKTILLKVSADLSITEENMPVGVTHVVAVLAGHAFVMRSTDVNVFTRATVLPSYGSKSLLSFHAQEQGKSLTASPYELHIPKPVTYSWDHAQKLSAITERWGFCLEPISGKTNITVIPYDCETGRCDRCGEGVTHPVLLSAGLGVSKIQTFVGPECPYVLSPGCYTQFVSEVLEHADENTTVILAAHYGSKFDHQFLMQTLLSLRIPFEVVRNNSKIQCLQFADGRVRTFDTANVYPGSLKAVSDTAAKSAEVMSFFPPGYISHGKYQAFPYSMLDLKYPLGLHPVDLLMSDDAWGDKFVDRPADIPGWRGNLVYMQTNFPTAFTDDGDFDTLLLTRLYCEEDVRLLALIIVMHYVVSIQQPVNNRVPYLPLAITASQRAWATFLTCYLDRPLPGKNRHNADQVKVQINTEFGSYRLTESDLVSQMIQGGLTVNNQRYYKMKPGEEMIFLDINSSYPYAMLSDLPVEFDKTTHLDSPMRFKDVISRGLGKLSDWYLVSADFSRASFNQRPLTVKYRMHNIGVDYTPFYWYEGKNIFRLNIKYGVELDVYTKFDNDEANPMIMVKSIFHYKTAPIFKQYVTDLYAKRLAAKAAKNLIEDATCKLCLNSTFGKTCQKEKDRVMFLQRPEEEAQLANVSGGITELTYFSHMSPNPSDESNPLKHHILQVKCTNERLGPGEHAVIGAAILSIARATFASASLCIETTMLDSDLQPIQIVQGDTDSILFLKPPQHIPSNVEAWSSFQKTYMDEARLGAWKVEAVGTHAFYGAGKKNYCLTSLDENGKEVIKKMACKGAPSSVVYAKGPSHFKSLVLGGIETILIPTSFKMRNDKVMIKTSISRRLKCGNDTRQFSDDPACPSKPWSDLNIFWMAKLVGAGVQNPAIKYPVLSSAVELPTLNRNGFEVIFS